MNIKSVYLHVRNTHVSCHPIYYTIDCFETLDYLVSDSPLTVVNSENIHPLEWIAVVNIH